MRAKKNISQKRFERKLTREAKKMTNEELRKALWSVRKQLENNDQSSSILTDKSMKSLIMEAVYSNELKRRELLEWALKTGS